MLVRQRTYSPTFDRTLDRTFEQLTNSFYDQRRANGPVIDGAWIDEEYVLTVDLPGVPAEQVSVEVTGTTLTLGATTDSMEWKRSVRLGGRLDPDKVTARHLDGRLTVRIGAVDEPEARSIAIDTTAPERAIEATSSETDGDDAPQGETQSTDTNDTE